MSGDPEQLAAVQAEQAGMQTRLFAAEVAEIQRNIAEAKAELIEAKALAATENAKSRALLDEIHALQKRHEVQMRESGIAENAVGFIRDDIRRLENRLELIVSEQAGYAETLRAPIMRSLWHAPKRR